MYVTQKDAWNKNCRDVCRHDDNFKAKKILHRELVGRLYNAAHVTRYLADWLWYYPLSLTWID